MENIFNMNMKIVNNLNEVIPNKNTTYFYKNYSIELHRVNNDINGNPLYKIELCKDYIYNINSKLKGLVYRCYNKKGYSLIQSYDINKSLENIFNNLD